MKKRKKSKLVLLKIPIETFMFCQMMMETHIEMIASDVSFVLEEDNTGDFAKYKIDELVEYCKDLNFDFWKHLKKNTNNKEYQRMKIIYKNGEKSNDEIFELLSDIGL